MGNFYEEYDDDFIEDYDDYEYDMDFDLNEMMDLTAAPFLQAFIWEKEPVQNRFNRYLKQFKINMFETIKHTFSFKSVKASSKGISLNDISDYIIHAITQYYVAIYTENQEPDIDMEQFIDNMQMIKYLYNLSRDLPDVNDIIKFVCAVQQNKELIHRIIEDTIQNMCTDIIAIAEITNEDVTEYNFLKTAMPENEDVYIKYFNDIIQNVTQIFLNIYIQHDHAGAELSQENTDLILQLKEVEKEFKRLNRTIQKKDKTIEQLKEKLLKQKEKKQNITEKAIEKQKKENLELTRQIATLNKQVKMLEENLEKCKKEKVTIVEEKKEETREEKIEPNWKEMKILFIASENTAFENSLKNTFPNAKITFDNFNIDVTKFDCVMIITTHVNHPTYYTFKQKCTKANVKFLHCENTNVEKIKEIIVENM